MIATRLYIKRHAVTGVRYLGKYTKKNILSYAGSGKYWKNHLKKHGDNVQTLWVSEWFYDEQELQDFALMISEFYDIVNSNKWANLVHENGLSGGPEVGRIGMRAYMQLSFEKRATYAKIGGKKTFEKGVGLHKLTSEEKARAGEKGGKNGRGKGCGKGIYERQSIKCRYCDYVGSPATIGHYHNERCKHRVTI